MKEAVFELLERINKIKNQDERARAIWDACQAQSRLKDVIYYGLSDNVAFDLPEGDPPYNENNEVNSYSIMWAEIRRLYLFSPAGKNLTPLRRQQLFIEMLEGVHPKDATLLLALKSRKWPFSKINAQLVDRIFPGMLQQVITEGGARRDA